MKLNVNKEHLKANISSLVVAGCLTLFIGGTNIVLFNENYTDEEKQYYLNEFNDIKFSLIDNLNIGNDLDIMTSVKINANNDNKWLNDCKNINSLEIIIRNEDINKLKNITNISNLKEVCIKSLRYKNDIIFNEENFAFLKNCKNLSNITFDNVQVDPDFLEQFNTLERITFEKNTFYNCNLDFTKFSKLSFVNFGTLKTYNIGMFMTYENIDYFKNNDICVSSNTDSNLKDNLIKMDKELDKIAKSLWGVNKESTDKEKLNAILKFIMINFNYSEKFLEMSESEQLEYKKEILYKDGLLYGSLYNDGEIICGNYASLFQALANRLELESYFMASKNHAWNLVNIENNYYYTDVTWLDQDNSPYIYEFLDDTINMLNNDESISFLWYLNEPNVYLDESHIADYSPYNINIYLEDRSNSDFTKWKYKVQLFDGDWFILSYLSLTYFLMTIWHVTIKEMKNNSINEENKGISKR